MAALPGIERRSRLVKILERDGAVRLESAAEELGVSAMTIRRDLSDLELAGLLRRVRGGAVEALSPRPFGERSTTRSGVKIRIARKVVELVPESGLVAFDASSTSGMLIAELGARHGLVIATNSLDNADAARRTSGVRSLFVGGELEERTGSFIGSLATRAAAQLSYEQFFSSASAVHPESGTTEVSLEEADVKTVFARRSGRTILLVDSSKLDQHAAAAALEWNCIDLMVTELNPADPRLDPYREIVELR